MERQYRGAQRLAGHRTGEREKDLSSIESLVDRDAAALALSIEMRGSGFKPAATAMLARYRKANPDSRICPNLDGTDVPHLLGAHVKGYYWVSIKWLHYKSDCALCVVQRKKQYREEFTTSKYNRRKRIPTEFKRVQQSQHRPGAAREERQYSMAADDSSPWRPSRKNSGPRLKRSWQGVKGLMWPPTLEALPGKGMAGSPHTLAWMNNKLIIEAELRRRYEARMAKKLAKMEKAA